MIIVKTDCETDGSSAALLIFPCPCAGAADPEPVPVVGDAPPDVHRDHDHAHAPPLAGRGHHRAPVQPRLLLRTHAQIFFRQFRNSPHSRDCSHCGQENSRRIIRDSYSEEKGNIIQNQFCLFGIHVEKDRRSPLVMIYRYQFTMHIALYLRHEKQ